MMQTGLLGVTAIVPMTLGATDVRGVNGPRFGSVNTRTGLQMHYAEQGDERGEPVILLHGYTDSWFSYSLAMKQLPANLHVYAPDLRGHGKTARPTTGYTMTAMAADVVAFMDAKGISQATIVGHSMGGFIAQRIAQTAPRRVSRLVLVATATAGRAFAGVNELKSAVETLTDPVPDQFAREFQVSTVQTPVPDAFMETAIAGSREMPARVWKAILRGILEDRPLEWPRRRIPTLVVWGNLDTYATRVEQDALLRMIPGSIWRAYTNTGHAVHWERPADFARDVATFIART
jgi:pimeloyl-ACP methyl ester carboxylesterase